VVFKIVVSGIKVLCFTSISWYMKGFPLKIGKHNPCLRRDLYGIGRDSFPISTDPPEQCRGELN